MKHEPPVDLRGAVLYHCGPVVVKEGDGWRVTAAGPTTSIREEPYQAEIIKRYGVRAVIGKGGMGAKTLAGAEGVRRRLPERDRRRGAVLRALHRARGRRVAAGVRHARSDVAPRRSRISRRSSRWTRTATACTRTSSRRRARCSKRCAADDATSITRSPQRVREQLLERRRRVRRILDVDPDRPPVVRFERLGVAERLRALQRPRTCSPPPESPSPSHRPR